MTNNSVAIVEDNHDIRQALEQIIESSNDFTLAGSCVTGEEAILKLPILNPKVVLMDIGLGDGMNGIEVVRELKAGNPEILFMMCTIYEEDEKIFEALRAGASGYILKKTQPAKLLEGITELIQGGAPMSSQIASKVVAAFQNKSVATPTGTSLEVLSKRENEILEMLSTGLLYKEISDKLFITTETVRKHVYHIYEKLHVTNRVEAVNKYFGR
ncbi:MAG: response regulator transcription factor [Chitinophagaceae bacterium]|nr:response regulator transcription factor [Chitinophagaceae bacterium]MBK7309177.1 response regulator transcription factor [Chitinophagaceae bacterium]MBK8786183.1 response regulator transcription factor [Chitinophagaceae bacterium]MBL0200074.1 response regulator transcription factor [Chitinophagaceae bacterium]